MRSTDPQPRSLRNASKTHNFPKSPELPMREAGAPGVIRAETCKSVMPEVQGEAVQEAESLDLDEIYRSASFGVRATQRDFYFGKR